MTRKQIVILAGAALIAAAGVGTGAAIAASGSPGQPAASATASPTASAGPGYSWYRSMMGSRYGNGGGSPMMGSSSYGSYGSYDSTGWSPYGTTFGTPYWMPGGAVTGWPRAVRPWRPISKRTMRLTRSMPRKAVPPSSASDSVSYQPRAASGFPSVPSTGAISASAMPTGRVPS